jgi:hypothetical protein
VGDPVFATVVNNDVTSHRTNPLDPVFSPFLAYIPVSGIATFAQEVCQVKLLACPIFTVFLGAVFMITDIASRAVAGSERWVSYIFLPFASKFEPDGLPYAFSDYLMLVDWTGGAIRTDKRGYIPANLAPILARLGLDGARWLKQVTLFRRQGIRVVGDKAHCRQFAHHCGQQRCHQPPY